MEKHIYIKGAMENNLKNISLSIPRNKITAVVGVSGSGKSTLVLETLQKESLRQFFETMGNQEQIKKPMVESITGLSPVIYINQHITNRNPRSTVGTMTEILKYLRLLFSQAGIRECQHCGNKIMPVCSKYITENDESDEMDEIVSDRCPHCGHYVKIYRMSDFSYNNSQGACPKCHGIGQIHSVNRQAAIDEELSIGEGAFKSWGKNEIKVYVPIILNASKYYGFKFEPHDRIRELVPAAKAFIYYGNDDERFKKFFPNAKRPIDKKFLFRGFINDMESVYEKNLDNEAWTERFGKFMEKANCSLCKGTRLSGELERIRILDTSINRLMGSSLEELRDWLLTYREYSIAHAEGEFVTEILDIMLKKLEELVALGLGYLTLTRSVVSLSNGEHQRLRLANLLGSSLTEMIYILDEPTIGLHPSDNNKVIKAINMLKNQGNTIIIIEHDLDLIKQADYIVEIGPGAGTKGGHLLFSGTIEEIKKAKDSIIRKYLMMEKPALDNESYINCEGIDILHANKHNLKDINVKIVINKLNMITGVSGSGKSSLVFDVLVENWEHIKKNENRSVNMEGYENIDNIICMTQKPISKGNRTNIATYTDIYTNIRQLFEKQIKAKELGLGKKDFSFNVKGGRCEYCEGRGSVEFNMVLMPSMKVKCPKCRGQRFNREVLEVKYKDRSIAEILNTTCEEALAVFVDVPEIYKVLKVINNIGLGYLTIGHQLNQMSGGECQRIRLVKELSKNIRGQNLYIFDEPTTGLHPQDVERLYAIMRELITKGHTLIVIEHNLDIISKADHIIDLGAGGGENGGNLIYQGNVKGLLRNTNSLTGKCLNEYLSGV